LKLNDDSNEVIVLLHNVVRRGTVYMKLLVTRLVIAETILKVNQYNRKWQYMRGHHAAS